VGPRPGGACVWTARGDGAVQTSKELGPPLRRWWTTPCRQHYTPRRHQRPFHACMHTRPHRTLSTEEPTTISFTFTMLGCCSDRSTLISRRAVTGKPSGHGPSFTCKRAPQPAAAAVRTPPWKQCNHSPRQACTVDGESAAATARCVDGGGGDGCEGLTKGTPPPPHPTPARRIQGALHQRNCFSVQG
jgi:hypothetical protein